jgi:hypothetical protein
VARGQGKPDPQRCACHADQAESAGTLSAWIDSLDDCGLGRRHGSAEEILATTRPTNDHDELTKGTSRKTPRATNPGQTRYGSGGRPWDALAHKSDRSRHAPPAEDITASCSGVAPSSRRRIRPRNGPVSPAKTVNRSVAEMSIRRARRVSGLNRDPIISVLRGLAEMAGRGPNTVSRTIMSHLRVPASLRDDAG